MRLVNTNDMAAVDMPQSKRQHERREGDQCVAEINGKNYPIMNWSQGGVLIFGDERLFAAEEDVEITLKFHVMNKIVPICSTGRVLRKSNARIAVQFDSTEDVTRRQFQQVIDDVNTRAFADSQA